MTERPHILYLFRGAGHGGDAIATLRLAAAMRDRGMNVRCAASPFEDRFDAFSALASTHALHCDPVPYYDQRGGSRVRFAAELARYARKLRPRVVHLVTGNGFVNPSLAMTLAAAHRGRRIVTLQGVRSHELTAPNHIRDQNISERFFHGIITPTAYARECYLLCASRPRQDQVHVAGNLVGPPTSISRCAMRKALGIACDAELVLFAARLVETKGPLVAVRAYVRVAEKHPNSTLVLAGDGPELASCRAAAQGLGDRVRFLGFRDDIANLMNAADIHLAASQFESFGLTTLEAMAAGALNVAFDIPATRELLGGTGRLAAYHDDEPLATHLDWALSNPDQCRGLAQLAKVRYETSYSLHAIVQRHLEIYGMTK